MTDVDMPTALVPRLDDPARVAEDGRAALVGYLEAATPIVTYRHRGADVLGDGPGPDVGVASDGTWLWSQAVTYYLARYGVPLDADLEAHVRAQPGPPPPVSPDTARRAVEIARAAAAEWQ